jgi:hypothetical protein
MLKSNSSIVNQNNSTNPSIITLAKYGNAYVLIMMLA